MWHRWRALGALAGGGATVTAHSFFSTAEKKPPMHSGPPSAASALLSANCIARAAKVGFVCTHGGAEPHCRVMDVRRLDENDESLTFSLAAELKRQPRCTLAFHDPRAGGEAGYLSLSGEVREVLEPRERRRVWKESWTLFHTAPEVPPPASDTLVFLFCPDRVELCDNERWLRGDWAPISLARVDGRWEYVPPLSRQERCAIYEAAAAG